MKGFRKRGGTEMKDGGPAFPFHSDFVVASGEHQGKAMTTPGMTLRDFFAASAVSRVEINPPAMTALAMNEAAFATAKWAYQLADALLYVRKGGET
jgi:hypothetical protein